ncbi:MAG: DUF5721 family protein [Lachnospiraceae bacterium]|nr:DUF5721 family protein [Lachnospiraceae bacterium]
MILLRIKDVKSFMGNVLARSVFDDWLISEFDVVTSHQFYVSGRINKKWYSAEELEALSGREYMYWSEVRGTAFDWIKGKKTPTSMHIVLLADENRMSRVYEATDTNLARETLSGLFLNIKFEKEELTITTGTSLTVFSMDKSIEQSWDRQLIAFLSQMEIEFEQL